MVPSMQLLVRSDAEAEDRSPSDLESGSVTEGEGSEEGQATRPPTPDDLICGVDKRPWLPVSLYVSTALGGVYVLSSLENGVCFVLLTGLYVTSLACMVAAASIDPGQIELDPEEPLPKRSHKSWQYPRPVRRYDHYCRWLVNTIGLRNHREFAGVLITLVCIGFVGVGHDVYLAVELYFRDQLLSFRIALLALHLAYSVGMLAVVGPIAKIHCGLIARNEVSQEWKKDLFYCVLRDGERVAIADLEEGEDVEGEAQFYDKSRNPWDKGAANNCLTFWFTSRWTTDQMGEF